MSESGEQINKTNSYFFNLGFLFEINTVDKQLLKILISIK